MLNMPFKCVHAFFCVALALVLCGEARAAKSEADNAAEGNFLVPPGKAFISPAGGRLEVRQEVTLLRSGENSAAEIIVPQDAGNLQITVPGKTIIRWNSTPIALHNSSAHETRRNVLENERNELAAKLETVNARLQVWKAQTQAATAQEISHRQTMMEEQMPKLGEEKGRLEKQLNLVLGELSEMPANSGLGQRIEIILAGRAGEREKATVEYSYHLASCGWRAIYDFNANPDTNRGDVVDVRLLAEVWQYSGIDWDGTEITLATSGNGPREPRPLRKWVVGNTEQKPAPKPETDNAQPRARASAATMKLAAVNEEEDRAVAIPAETPPPPVAPVTADTETVYASWSLSARGLPEGQSRILISSDAWKAPLQWLARPSTDNSRVWLLAKYTLPPNQAWPAGQAQYSVNGQSIGEGKFSPRRGEAVLYFGADPRVTVHTTVDSNKEGETGFINASKTWTGAWTYTFTNMHSVPIKVKVERPDPIVGNDNITVTYKDNPKATVDEKEHIISWNIEIPANGKESIEHSLIISSPVKLPLFPDVP